MASGGRRGNGLVRAKRSLDGARGEAPEMKKGGRSSDRREMVGRRLVAVCGREMPARQPAVLKPGARFSTLASVYLARDSQAGGTTQVLSVMRKTWGWLEGRPVVSRVAATPG